MKFLNVILCSFPCGSLQGTFLKKKKSHSNLSKSSIELFQSFGLEMDLTQMSKYSSCCLLHVGHHKFGQRKTAVGSLLRLWEYPHVTVSCCGLGGFANFQCLISFWPSSEKHGANDKDKQGLLPGTDTEILLEITAWRQPSPRTMGFLLFAPALCWPWGPHAMWLMAAMGTTHHDNGREDQPCSFCNFPQQMEWEMNGRQGENSLSGSTH